MKIKHFYDMFDSSKVEYVDADIAQELYDHLKHVIDQGRSILDGDEPEGDDEDFENWFLSACKTIEKADRG